MSDPLEPDYIYVDLVYRFQAPVGFQASGLTSPIAWVELCSVSALGKTVRMGSTAWLGLFNASVHVPMGGSAL